MARKRATAIVVRDGKLLLVRDKGKRKFSLPGGGVNRGEPSLAAAARELFEETRLSPSKVEFLCKYRGAANSHRVFWVEAHGEVHITHELDGYVWWDREESIPRLSHVDKILKMCSLDHPKRASI